MEKKTEQAYSSIIEGRNSVTEAINAGRTLEKVFVSKGDKTLRRIAQRAKETGAVIVETDRRALDAMSEAAAHQGIIAHAAVAEYRSVSDILDIAASRGERPFVIVCDGLTDPQNLGAVIRTAECAGAHGVIIPKRRSAGLTAAVGRASAGAVWHMAVARVSNITAVLKDLKAAGLWVFGTDPGGEGGQALGLWNAELTGPVCVVIGSEGEGMSRLVRECCDFLVGIPMFGATQSLNASAAAAVVMYEALRQRSSTDTESKLL